MCDRTVYLNFQIFKGGDGKDGRNAYFPSSSERGLLSGPLEWWTENGFTYKKTKEVYSHWAFECMNEVWQRHYKVWGIPYVMSGRGGDAGIGGRGAFGGRIELYPESGIIKQNMTGFIHQIIFNKKI